MKFLDLILDLLFPSWCCHCGTYGELLCLSCFKKITFAHGHIEKVGQCDSLSFVTVFTAVTRDIIHTLKYQSVKKIALVCARMMYLYGILPKVDLVTAIPLHPIRYNERGFNQSEEIAKELARLLELPYCPLLIRRVHTKNLARITDKNARKETISNQFISLPLLTTQLNNKSVLIVDDVVTTGATLEEAAKIIKLQGASQIHGLAFTHEA